MAGVAIGAVGGEEANAEHCSALASFVPSRYRARLRESRPGRPQGRLSGLRLVGAWAQGEPVGAGLAAMHGGWASCESLYVVPRLRGRGIGRALLDALEGACAEADTIAAVLPDDERFLGIRRLLVAGGWDPPRLRHRQFEVDDGIRASPTLTAPHDLSRYEVMTFSGSGERERRELARIAGGIPPGLDPLEDEENVIAPASLLLRRAGRIVGWGVSRHFAPGTALIPTVWVAPSERGGGLGALLGLLAIRATLDAGYRRVRFVVDADNAPMIRIVERVVLPYGATERGLLETSRRLGERP